MKALFGVDECEGHWRATHAEQTDHNTHAMDNQCTPVATNQSLLYHPKTAQSTTIAQSATQHHAQTHAVHREFHLLPTIVHRQYCGCLPRADGQSMLRGRGGPRGCGCCTQQRDL